MKPLKLHFAVLLGFAAFTQGNATTPGDAAQIPPDVFARLPAMDAAVLSPDGTHIAYLSPRDGKLTLMIERLGPDASRMSVPALPNLTFEWVNWANNERLVFATSLVTRRNLNETRETRLMAIDRDGENLQSIMRPSTRIETGSRIGEELPPPQLQDRIIDWMRSDPEQILVAVDGNYDTEFEVRRVNVHTGKFREVGDGYPGVQNWIADQNNDIRLGWGYRVDDFMLRLKDSQGDWSSADDSKWARSGFEPLAFTEDPAVAYMRGPNEAGRLVIRTVNVDSDEMLETVFEHETADAGQLVIDPVTGFAAGVEYTEDMPGVHYFEAALRSLQRSIDSAFPDTNNRIVSMSSDRMMLLVLASSDVDPGVYYLWDRGQKSIGILGEKRPDLPAELLSPTNAIAYKARDGLEIPAYLTIPTGAPSKNLPLVVMLHDGPHQRVDRSFSFMAQFLASRGYAVFQPNFRGSSGYGREFELAGRGDWGGKMQDDIDDGVAWLIEQGIIDPKRVCIAGWSYGGYAAAMGAVNTPDQFRCAITINGILNLDRQIAVETDLEIARRYVDRQAFGFYISKEGAELKAVSPYHQAERIRVPMLIVQAADDPRVQEHQGRTMAGRLNDLGKDVRYIAVKSGGHEIVDEEARLQILRALETFLAENIGSG